MREWERLEKKAKEEEAGVGKMSCRFGENKAVTKNMDFGDRPSQVQVDRTSVSSSNKMGHT